MKYQWPMDVIASALDQPQPQQNEAQLEAKLAALGLDQFLVDFLAPLYSKTDGATLFDKGLRMHPLDGTPDGELAGLADWNSQDGWKQYEPQKINGTFYFCSNAFGDQFGIPVDAEGKILNDRIGILWVERCEYQEAKLEWRTFFVRLAGEEAMRSSFLRRNEYDWAAPVLGVPQSWECFSSKVPPVLGGPDTIDNITIQSMPVHVSFSLQVIGQARRRTAPGDKLGVADLRDQGGRPI